MELKKHAEQASMEAELARLRTENEQLKKVIEKANALTIAAKGVIHVSNKFLSAGITKLEVAVQEYDATTAPK